MNFKRIIIMKKAIIYKIENSCKIIQNPQKASISDAFLVERGKMLTIQRAIVLKEYNTEQNELLYLTGRENKIQFHGLKENLPSGEISLTAKEVKREFEQAISNKELFSDCSKERLCKLIMKNANFILEIENPDEDMQLAAVKHNPWIISKINNPAHAAIIATLIARSYEAVNLGYGRQDDEHFRLLNVSEIKSIIEVNPASMSGIPEDLITGDLVYTFLEQLVKQNKSYLHGAFSNIPEHFKDKMFWQCLCMVNGYNIVGIRPELREMYISEKLVHYTLEHSASYVGVLWLYQYIPDKLKTKDISMKCINIHPYCIEHLPDVLKNDTFYAEMAVYSSDHGNNFAWFEHIDISTISKQTFSEIILRYPVTRYPEHIPASYFTRDNAIQMGTNTAISIPHSVIDSTFYDAMAKEGIITRIPDSELSEYRISLLLESGNKRIITHIPDHIKTPELMNKVIAEGLYNNLNSIADFLTEDIVIDAINKGIVTRFDEIPAEYQNVKTAAALAKTDSKYIIIPRMYQTEEICRDMLKHKDDSTYEWMYTLLQCSYPPSEAVDHALSSFPAAIDIKGLSSSQIDKSIMSFPMNILKAPEWYVKKERNLEEHRDTAEKVSSGHTVSITDDYKQLNIFDILGM